MDHKKIKKIKKGEPKESINRRGGEPNVEEEKRKKGELLRREKREPNGREEKI